GTGWGTGWGALELRELWRAPWRIRVMILVGIALLAAAVTFGLLILRDEWPQWRGLRHQLAQATQQVDAQVDAQAVANAQQRVAAAWHALAAGQPQSAVVSPGAVLAEFAARADAHALRV